MFNPLSLSPPTQTCSTTIPNHGYKMCSKARLSKLYRISENMCLYVCVLDQRECVIVCVSVTVPQVTDSIQVDECCPAWHLLSLVATVPHVRYGRAGTGWIHTSGRDCAWLWWWCWREGGTCFYLLFTNTMALHTPSLTSFTTLPEVTPHVFKRCVFHDGVCTLWVTVLKCFLAEFKVNSCPSLLPQQTLPLKTQIGARVQVIAWCSMYECTLRRYYKFDTLEDASPSKLS